MAMENVVVIDYTVSDCTMVSMEKNLVVVAQILVVSVAASLSIADLLLS